MLLRILFMVSPCLIWLFLMRAFVLGLIPVNMDTNTIYGVTKFYFNNLLNGVVPLWEPFVSLGRPFYAISICNLFNPVILLVPLLKLVGINYAQGFVVYMVAYFFLGCVGFYLLAKEILKDHVLAYLGYLALMFSSLGASMFTQFTFLEMVVPTIWLFYFLVCFSRKQTPANFVGITLSKMIVLTSYLPFYFITVFGCFLIPFIFLFFETTKKFCMNTFTFCLKHWRLFLLCVIGGLLCCGPLLAYKILDSSGEVVAPGRHCQYTSAQECYDRTMNAQGGMSYEEITRSGTLGERVDMQYLLGNLDKVTYGSDSLFFLPFWIYLLLGVAFFLPLKRPTVLLTVMAVLIIFVAIGAVSGVHGFLYRHIFFFTYFRNLFFFGAFLVPIVILLGLYQLQQLLEVKFADVSAKKIFICAMLVLHGLVFLFLRHYEGVPSISYMTCVLSAIAFCIYYAMPNHLSKQVWTAVFAVVLILEPAWVLKSYATNAQEFATALPSMHVKPEFAWERPLQPAVSHARIYQFVPYEDFWYDMSMTDAPPVLANPQSAARWTFDLSEHTAPNVLAAYAQYKIFLYDNLNAAGHPVTGPSLEIGVDHFDVNQLALRTDFTKPQILVYNDSYTSSWKAAIDGKPVALFRANTAFKGVNVPAGAHEVQFSYQPPGGSWVYVMATAVLFIFLCATIVMLYWESINRDVSLFCSTNSQAEIGRRPYLAYLARNIVLWGLIGLVIAPGVNWRLCTIERGKYLLGIFYNGHFQNTLDGQVYQDYLKTHGITHEFIQENI